MPGEVTTPTNLNGFSALGNGGYGSDEVPGTGLAPHDPGDSEILAALDRLRVLGIDQQYDLPQIIVCGSQSAGKSSVLESLVQVPFPRGEGTCTRYVTKVTIERADIPSIDISILPGKDRSESDAARLRRFSRKDGSKQYAAKLADFMKEAHDVIFKDRGSDEFPSDVLLITVYGPENRPLQVLDLPGLIAYDQREKGNDLVTEDMVTKHMEMKSSIILVVVKATEELNNQRILKLCKDHDPEGARTLGIITRPDRADQKANENLVKVMQGMDEEFKFQYKWHVVRNRATDENHLSQTERDQIEEDLLSQYPWNQVGKGNRGIRELRERLRELLFTLAKKELPSLCNTFSARLKVLHKEFEALGGEEFRPEDLQSAFEQSIKRLREAARDHSRGQYESNIRNFDPTSAVRLRSRVVEQSEVFRDTLVAVGHAWKTQIKPTSADPDVDLGSVYKPHRAPLQAKAAVLKTYTSQKDEIDSVVKMLNHTRGAGLPTFFDPKRIHDLFWLMSEGWGEISKEHVERIYVCCKEYFRHVTPVAFQRESGATGATGFSSSKKVADKFVGPYIVPALDKCRKEALQELNRLEQDRLDAPITADLRFLKDRRSHHQGREFQRAMKAYHEVDMSSATGKDSGTASQRLDQTTYARHAGQHSQQDLTAGTAETYLDAMWSHYLIERDIYITNVLRQVVERHFLRHLAETLPKELKLEEIEELTRKDDKDEIRKKEIKGEIKILKSSLAALKGIQ